MYQYFCFCYSQVYPPTLQGYFLFIPSHVVQIIGRGGGLVSILDYLQWDSIQEEYGAISWAPLWAPVARVIYHLQVSTAYN